MNELEISGIADLLAQPCKIAIIPHRNPDGDAMGSTLGLLHFLSNMGHSPTVVSPNEMPHFLKWLPGAESVVVYEGNKDDATKVLEEAAIVFTLDFNVLLRTGEMEEVLSRLTAPMMMIDHHEMPADYALYRFSDTSYASTCEMVYQFIQYLGKDNLIDLNVATCLYCGIVTDTGSFRFPKTSSTTHQVVSRLIEKGVRNAQVHQNLYDNNSYDGLQLLGRALSNLRVLPEYKTSYITLSAEELAAHQVQKGDTEGFVNYGLSIKGIEFTVIFIERVEEGIIKISLRSKGDFDVNKLARQHFEGGGHMNAAGGKSVLSLEETVARFLEIIKTQHP